MITTAPALLALSLLACAADQVVTVSEARKDDNGFLVHEVRSPYQAGTTYIRVLLPDKLEHGKRYPVIYLLPVEAAKESRYGDGLLEVKKLGLHNKYQAIFVAPTFSHLPWYADHPTNQTSARRRTSSGGPAFYREDLPGADQEQRVGCCWASASRVGVRSVCSCVTRTCSARRSPGTPR